MNQVKSTGVQGFIIALSIHLVGIGGIFIISPAEPARASYRPPVKVRVIERPRPSESPPPKADEVKVEEPVVVKPKKPLRKRVAKTRPPVEKPAVTATRAQVDPVRTATPRKFTVAMEATVPGGGVTVPAAAGGGWAFGAPEGDEQAEKVLAGPAPVVEEKIEAPVEAAGVTRLPRLLTQPSLADMRQAYPEQARRNGEEANVYLKILVSAGGEVSRVRVIRSSGNGFEQAAVKLVKRFRFRPGEVDGRAVAVWIPWTYKFRLEG